MPELTFHPCDGFGPEAWAAAGFDGNPPDRWEDRVDPFQQFTCWFNSRTPEYGVAISANGIPLAEVESDERFTLRRSTSIGGHRALLHDFPGGLSCIVSIGIDPGVLEIMVGYKTGDFETADQACPQAMKVATDLAPYFPDKL